MRVSDTALVERERILAIIRDHIYGQRLDGRKSKSLEALLDDIAFKSGLTAADVRVPGGTAPRA